MNACSKKVAIGCSLVLAAALQSGCASTPKTSDSAPPSTTKTTQQPRPQVLSGKVVETIDSGGYTYVNLEKDGKRVWVAMPPLKVEVGQDLKVWSGTEMGSFTSKTLNRTFDSIIFSPGVATDDALQKPAAPANAGTQPALPPGHPKIAQQQGNLPASSKDATSGSTISGKVVETMNSGGYTYVNLEKDGNKRWVAAPTMQVSLGQELNLQNGMPMTNFSSKALNRTFDSIIFSPGPATGK